MFYDIFVELCKIKGEAPSFAAAKLGINKSNVSNWKNHGYTPRGKALNDIALYFNVTADFLLGSEKKEKPAQMDELANLTDEERELILLYRKASPDTRKAVDKIVE